MTEYILPGIGPFEEPTVEYVLSGVGPVGALPTFIVALTNSTYISSSGSGTTTAQLTPPSGKSASDFQVGKISDDTNPVPAIDLAADKYTELEFMVEVSSSLVSASDEIEFRITNAGTVIDTYTFIPKITAGSGFNIFPLLFHHYNKNLGV